LCLVKERTEERFLLQLSLNRLLRRTMPKKNNYPYPSKKNPIILGVSGSAQLVKGQLIELEKRIIANEKEFQRKNDKIPAL
jgi:hypothetical protein